MFRFSKILRIILSAAIILTMCSCEFKTAVAVGIPKPEDSITDFFDCVCAGNYSDADRYLSGFSLKMNGQFTGPFSEKLYDYLQKSFRYRLLEMNDDNPAFFECKVEFTFLDNNLLADDLKALATERGKAYIAANNMEYLEKKDGVLELSDEGAERTAVEALDELMKTPSHKDDIII